MSETAIERTAKVLTLHQIEWIGAEEGYDCGCNDRGDQFPSNVWYLSEALTHVAQALAQEGLLVQDEEGSADE